MGKMAIHSEAEFRATFKQGYDREEKRISQFDTTQLRNPYRRIASHVLPAFMDDRALAFG